MGSYKMGSSNWIRNIYNYCYNSPLILVIRPKNIIIGFFNDELLNYFDWIYIKCLHSSKSALSGPHPTNVKTELSKTKVASYLYSQGTQKNPTEPRENPKCTFTCKTNIALGNPVEFPLWRHWTMKRNHSRTELRPHYK